MKTSDSIINIAKALLAAQSEMGMAIKGATNPFFKSSYADLNSIRTACMPCLNKHGIIVLQPTVDMNDKSFVETVLIHSSGEFIAGITEIRTVKKDDPQAMGSGVSYARRYGLQSMLSMGVDDDDGESAMDRTPTKPVQKRQVDASDCQHTFAPDKFNKGKLWCTKCKVKKDA